MSDIYLFRASLRELLRPKNIIGISLLVLLGPIIAGLWRANTAAEGVYNAHTVYNAILQGMVFGFVLLLLAVIFGTSSISQEVEGKTIVYLLTRPVPRWRILLVKFLAVGSVVLGSVWLSTLLIALVTYGPSGLGDSPLARDMTILPLAVLAYGGLFLLLGVTINRAMLYGLLFAFGWESWVPSLPGSFSRVSLMTYLRILAPHTDKAPAAQATSALMNTAGDVISQGMAWTVLLAVTALSLGAALWMFSVREYVPREEAA